MTREDYTKQAIEKYPPLGVLMDEVRGFNHVDLVYTTARYLFMDGECQSDLAIETRRLLWKLREVGMLEWIE